MQILKCSSGLPGSRILIYGALLPCISAALMSCSTVMTPQKTETMGTEQLLWYLESDQDFGKLWAAETLGYRLLTNDQIDQLVAAIESDSSPAVRVQVIESLARVLAKRDDVQLNLRIRGALLDLIPMISNDKVCLRAMTFADSLSPDAADTMEYAMRFMQENRHGRVRYWCLEYVISHGLECGWDPDIILAAIHRTLTQETDAAVAELACRELGRRIYRPSLSTLEAISNSGSVRTFESANYNPREGRKTRADVITAAIRYAEGIRYATGDL